MAGGGRFQSQANSGARRGGLDAVPELIGSLGIQVNSAARLSARPNAIGSLQYYCDLPNRIARQFSVSSQIGIRDAGEPATRPRTGIQDCLHQL